MILPVLSAPQYIKLILRRVRDFECSRIINKYYLNVRQKHPSSEIEALTWICPVNEIVSTYARKHESFIGVLNDI